jgi:NADPH:quinone reductase-like Zn-dependent oxidoreductase
MRAVGVEDFGGPAALQVFEVAEPHAGPGELRIRVRAATVNPTDTGLRAGWYGPRLNDQQPPYIPGMDAAGVIDEVGDGSTTVDGTPWQLGDEVMAIVLPTEPRKGAYAEQIVVPAASVARLPKGTDAVAASGLPMNGLTARVALDELGLRPGQTIAVTGAAGAFGGYIVQLAKADGLRVIADASEADEQLVRDLGADDVVRRGDDVADRIRALVPEGVDGLADGAVQSELVVDAIADGGGMAVVRGWNGDPGRGITVHKIMVFGHARDTEALDQLRQRVEDGVVTLRVAQTFPAEQAAEAHRTLEAGGVRGRLVLTFD